MPIRVINKSAKTNTKGTRINVMRGTVLGNRFTVNKYSRVGAIECFRQNLMVSKLRDGTKWRLIMEIAERVRNGETILIECCCKPKACHGEVIKSAVQSLL